MYIVTGIKVARGVKVSSVRSRAVVGEAAAEVDGTVWGAVPVSGGPGVAGGNETRQNVAWEGGSDFVFAFRVRKVVVERHTNAVKMENDYTAGALLGTEPSGGQHNGERPVLKCIAEDEVDAEREGLSVERLKEGDETVVCVIPNNSQD